MKLGYITIFILFSSLIANAQLVVNGATIKIGSAASVDIDGSVSNGGTIFNFGEIAFSGDWENKTEYDDRGTVRLKGYNQAIISNGGYYNQLVVSGGGRKSISGRMYIKDELSLTNGFLAPIDESRIVASDTAVIVGAGDDSFVTGFFYWEGSGIKFYPLGAIYEDLPYYRPAELHGVVADAGVVGMRYVRDAALMDSIRKTNRIKQVSPYGFWQMDIVSGTVSEAFLSIGYDLPDDFDNISDDMLVTIATADTLTSVFESTFVDKDYVSDNFTTSYVTSKDMVEHRFFILSEMYASNRDLLYIPNALSVSAPSIDDQAIKVYGGILSDHDFYFKIENQWGNTVYETTSLNDMETKGWQGHNQRTGKMEKVGQYHFLVKATFLDGTTYQNAGSVWIIN